MIFLPVAAASGIHLSHESAIKHPGDTFLVTCKDESGRAVAWSGARGHLGANTHPRVATASYGTSIYFTEVTVKDSGEYTCSAGTDKKHYHLTVEAPLTFMDTSPEQTGKEFTDVTLRCEVKGGEGGSDKPLVTWSIEKGDLFSDERIQVMGDGLLIKNVTREDSKTYICKAMQTSTGDFKEQRIQLKVEHKPVFRHPVWAKDEDAWGYIGGVVNLTCEVDAEPPPTFEWKMKKQIGQIHSSSHKTVLQLHITDPTVFDNYICIAKNKIGTLRKVFVLQQGVQAAAPDFIELRGANADLLDVGVHESKSLEKVPVGMEPTGYRLEYRAVEEKHWLHTDFPISEDNSYPLRELQHDTEYDVRAATINKAGISVYTNTSIFKTLTAQADGTSAITSGMTCIIIGLILLTNW